MADEDVTLNGKPLQSLRVADLKAALEQRCLPKSGAKNTLIKRLKGALMLENLQRTSTPHIGLQPNSQIGEEMSQNSFIKQYLAQQQELLRQRLEREAREAAEADESPAGPEEEEHTEEGNDSDSYHPDKHRPMPSQPPLTRAEEEGGGGGGPMMMGHQGQGMIMGQGMMSQGMGQGVTSRRPGSVPQESPDAPGGPGSWMQQRPSLQHGLHHEEPTTPSPPRAVASLSVRVLGDPERQGLPPSTPPRAQTQEKEGTAPADDDRPAHSVLHLSRSARAAAAGNRGQEDGGDDDSSEEDEDEWGPVAGVRRGGGSGCAPPPQPQQPSPSVPAARERSRRKLQPPQHIPPQQVAHQPPMQLRQPTPPPSPPPELSFPLPDTPKQSPPDMDEEPEGAGAGVGVRPPPGGLQRQDSDSSSRSSSPEPLAQRRPGPLSLLARKMASEGAFGKRGEGAQADGQTGPGGEVSGPGDGVGSSPGAGAGPGVGVVKFPGAAITHIGGSSSTRHTGLVTVPEVPAPGVMFGSGAQSHPLPLLSVAAVPSITPSTEPQGPSGETVQKRTEKEKEVKQEEERKQEEKEMKAEKEDEREEERKQEEKERKIKQEEKERKMKEEEMERKQEEEERKMKQEEKERKQEEERRMKKQEEERKMKQEEKERKMKQEEKERERKQEELRKMEEEVRKQQEKRKQEEKERKQQEEERKRKQQQQQQQEEERKMKEEEKERKMKQEEKDRKQEEKEREMKKKKEEKEREEKERKMKQQQQEEEKERKMKQEEKERKMKQEKERESHLKKSPFGRDEPSSSAPGSAMTTTSPPAISPKKPRMFSDTSSGSMTSPPKPEQQGSVVVTTPGEPPEPHGISVRPQVVLVSGAQQHTDDTMEVTALNKASVEKPGWKTGGEDGKMEKESDSQAEKERDSQVEKGTAKAWETRRRGPEETVEVEPMGPVLPPSYPGKEEEERRRKEDERRRKEDERRRKEDERKRKEDERKRKEDERKKEEERGRPGQRVRHRRSTPSSGGDSSSSDSGSSSSRSSGSTSSRDKKKKKTGKGKGWGDEKTRLDKGGEKKQPAREVKQSSLSEPSGPMEVERPDLGQTQPTPVGDPQNCEGHMEESTTPKAFAARKISLTTGSKTSPEGGAAGGEAECGTAAGRKRRWGSSTAVNAKKPSISITTDSLKSLIPDIKPNQEAVVDLHPDDIQLSEDEDTTTTRDTREDQGLDKGLKIRRTVTQVVPGENQENGQREREEEEEEEEEEEKKKKPECDKERTQKERTQKERKNSYSEDAMESQSSTTHDADAKKVTPSDTLVRRSISQQKSGVSVTIDDPVRTAKQPSPPRGKVSNIVHVCNLVRPFTLGQLKELLNRTGSVVEDGFWIDKIKSHCYVTYSSTEEAVVTRAALHGVKWPQSNPKVLSVDFCEQNELDFHRGLLTVDPREEHRPQPGVGPGGPKVRPGALPPLMDGRGDRGVVGGVRDQWAEREREMERRERTRAEREWDRDKVRDFGGKPGEERERGRRSRSLDRERRRKERDGKEKKSDKKDEPPAKLLDDLFNKTKAAPCIYWLPLTEEQATQRGKEREERQKERERRRKEQQEEEDKKREEERKERIKSREKEGGAAVSTGSVSVRGSEGDRERERERGRDREGDKRRDSGGFRPRGPDTKPSAGLRRSRSRSNPRDRRR